MSKRVNCASDYRFQARLRTPNAAGEMAAPATTGVITGVRLRLSASPYGAAIHVDVNDLEAIETATAGRFYYVVDKTLLTTHVLPLGAGASFYAVWSKSGDMDNESVEFVVASGTQN